MALTNEQITAKNFKKFYEAILPYLNGEAHASFTPVGSIIAIMGNEAPQNFLACDGTAYNIADYLELATYFNQQFGSTNYFGGDGTTTFAVPDLRGEFLRGTGTNGHENQGSGANVGVHQDGTEFPMISISGASAVAANFYRDSTQTNGNIPSKEDKKLKTGTGTLEYWYANTTKASSTAQTSNRYISRPTNTSVLYCIATKNVFSDISDSLEPGEGIVIEDNEISVDTMTAEDLQDVKDAFMPNTGTPMRMFNYSTDEQVVGKWIDGKPLYQKTFFTTMPNVTTEGTQVNKEIDISDLNPDYAVVIEGSIKYLGQWGMPICSAWSINNIPYSSRALVGTKSGSTNTYLMIQLNRSLLSGLDAYITIRYTKTTD